MQEQAEDQDLAGLARPRPAAARPVASSDATVMAPVPAPLDCPYLHLDDDGPGCLALQPAIRLSRRQVEVVCAVAAHVACPRLIKADASRAPVQVEPPPAIVRRRVRPPSEAAGPAGLAATLAAEPPAPAAPPADGAPAEPPQAPATHETEPGPAHSPGTAAHREPTPGAGQPPARPPAPGPAAATSARGRVAAPGSTAPPGASRVAGALTAARAVVRTHVVLRPATAAAWLIVLATIVLVIALLSAGGGLTLPPLATPSPGVAGASPSVAATSPTAVPSPSPSPAPTALPSSSPSSSPSASPPPSPSPSVASPFTPEQLAVLKPCPGKPGCYQYRIKSGDNLHNLATFFGVTYPALLAANPEITNPSVIHVGDRITIPIPVPTPSPTKTPKP